MKNLIKNKIHLNKSVLILLVILGLIYLSNLFFPITFDDDFAYAAKGNPFLLQAQEFLNWHGRYITHTIGRLILQLRDPLANILTSLLGILFILVAYNTVQPNFLKQDNKKDPYLLLILSCLLLSCLVASWTGYTQTIFMVAYALSFILLLLFLSPYLQLIKNKEYSISPILIAFLGILAGNSYESSVATIPLLLLIALFLKYKKRVLPLWYWIGILGFLMGFSILMLSPGNAIRLSGYGDPSNWEFMGNTYNWHTLGFQKYFYSLAKIYLLGTYPWLIYGAPFFITFGLILRKNLLLEKDWTKPVHIIPIIFFIYSWGLVSVMMAAPLFHGGPLNFGLTFLYISMVMVINSHLELNPSALFTVKRFAYFMVALALIIWLVMVPTWLHYRVEYNEIVDKINIAKQNNQSEIIVTPFTQYTIKTPFGNIIPVYLFTSDGFYNRMADYYEFEKITVDR